MKTTLLITVIFIFSLSFNLLNAQCTPDPACVDIVDASHNPGEICPLTLAVGTVGVPYNQVVTIIPPYEADIGSYGTVNIQKIILNGVDNLPPGISYQASATDMFPYNKYCVLLSGTPTTSGTYQLSIRVTPVILLGAYPVSTPEQTDDTSIAITINESSGIYHIDKSTFLVKECSPNPFSESTSINFISGKYKDVHLTIYDVLGNILYEETKIAVPGENKFVYTGSKLIKGIYFYSVTNGEKTYTRQLIKK